MVAVHRRLMLAVAAGAGFVACGRALDSGPPSEPFAADASPDAADEANGPELVANPSYAYPTANTDGGLVAPGTFFLTIQSERPATIFYTTDGREPTDASASSPSPTRIAIDASTTVAYRTEDDSTVRRLPITIDPALQANIGVFVTDVEFDRGGGPVVVAKPGEALSGKLTLIRWTCGRWCASSGAAVEVGDTAGVRVCCDGTTGACPSCERFYAYGTERTEGCLGPGYADGQIYPGTRTVVGFTIRAPDAPGSYPLGRAEQFDYSCQLDAGGLAGDHARVIVR